MHITVLDHKIDKIVRKNYHISNLDALKIDNYSLIESIEVNTLKSLATDILLIHESNPEFNLLDSSDHFGKIRIFFSEGTLKPFTRDEYNYYVPFDKLYTKLDNLLKNKINRK